LVAHSDKANAATPFGEDWPSGGIYARSQLQRLVAAELYRLDGGDPLLGSKGAFPGAAAELDYIGRPDDIPKLGVALKENSEHILSTFNAKDAK
jgi:hypothetical protein